MTEQILGGRYELQGLLGQGGMAQVYQARDRILGRTVAVKILRPVYSSDAGFVDRFQREARAAANLTHPNIVAVHDVGQEGNRHYIVMEYSSGPTLKEIILQRAPLTVDFALRVAEEVCAALEYAHRQGVIHRDIKPQNILLSEDEEVVKVADFGIAKSRLDPETTAERLALGTVKYISPEQAQGRDVLPQSDLYSVGVVLYEMLTGEQPFDGENPVSIALQHIETAPASLRRLNPYLPVAVEQIVLRALNKDPAKRFLSAREMRLSLEQYRLAGVEATGLIPQSTPMAAPTRDQEAVAPRAAAAPAYTPPRQEAMAPPRQPAAPRKKRGGLGWLGVLLLVLIAGGLTGLVVLVPQVFPNILPESPTPIPTATLTPTPVPRVPVPDLTGKTPLQARELLAELDLRYAEATETRYDPRVDPGSIVDQEPAYGNYVDVGSEVTVILGAEPVLARIPSVVGMSYQGARLRLEQEGFLVEREDVGCVGTPLNYVHDQSPAGNQMDIQGITVTLSVSSGDESSLPELLRVPLAQARFRIDEASLVVGYENGQTQEDMPPGIDIDDLGAPGQVISYEVHHQGRRIGTSGELGPGDPVPCGATIHLAYYAITP